MNASASIPVLQTDEDINYHCYNKNRNIFMFMRGFQS